MKLGFICLNVQEIEAVGMASVSTAAATATHPSEIPHCPRLHPIALGENEQRSVVRYRSNWYVIAAEPEARGRALALTQGILALAGWWRPAAGRSLKHRCRSGWAPVGKLARGGASAQRQKTKGTPRAL
jgi:hypothetical protein